MYRYVYNKSCHAEVIKVAASDCRTNSRAEFFHSQTSMQDLQGMATASFSVFLLGHLLLSLSNVRLPRAIITY